MTFTGTPPPPSCFIFSNSPLSLTRQKDLLLAAFGNLTGLLEHLLAHFLLTTICVFACPMALKFYQGPLLCPGSFCTGTDLFSLHDPVLAFWSQSRHSICACLGVLGLMVAHIPLRQSHIPFHSRTFDVNILANWNKLAKSLDLPHVSDLQGQTFSGVGNFQPSA